MAPVYRRHLVIALTDGEDSCSIVTPDGIRSAAGYSEAVLYWVEMSGRAPWARVAVPAWCATVVDLDTRPLSDAVSRTGGEVHVGDPVKAFTRVFDEFRQSYVLRYSPEGVERAGWHCLRVEVTTGRYTVRARPGYSGG
jgi:hypothetical protein